jgi:hypothetical protein
MSFFTEINIPESPWKIDYSRKIMLLGSCFSENIGQKLLDLKFGVDMNPFGIVYNPESIANGLKILLEQRMFTANDLFQDQGLWSSFYHHSRFSDVDRDVALEKINSRIALSSEFLSGADFLFVTFGTSWVFELKSTGRIVSNCHKVPASEFNRYRLSVTEITETYRALLDEIWKINPGLKVVFTVSPIRHWKDGAVENQVSKAILLLAIDQLRKEFGANKCGYFPAYELMMDELRDYRFYAEDMLHLSQVAVDYIFERFVKVLIAKESAEISKEIRKISKAFAHRPVNPNTNEFKHFLQQSLLLVTQLQELYPSVDLIQERNYFDQQLAKL